MPSSLNLDHPKVIFETHKGTPLIGMINKITKEIVLAPFIRRVELIVAPGGLKLLGGFYLDEESQKHTDRIPAEQFEYFEGLLSQGYIPKHLFIDAPGEEKTFFPCYFMPKKTDITSG